MDQKFSKLRFKDFTAAAAAAAIGGALALQPLAAMAMPENIGSGTGVLTVHAGNAVWFLNNDITFSTTSSDWGFSEASLHTVSGTRTDAFNGALSWHVNASPPGSLDNGGYVSPSGTVDITPFPINSSVGTTVTGAPQTLAGLTVTGQIYFSPVKAVARTMIILQNPTGAPITVTVDSDSNLGSGNNTFYQLTSSGDQAFDPTDNWVVTSKTASPTTADNPILTFAFAQTGALVRPTAIQALANGSRVQYLRYTVTVPAGQTRSLMGLEQMSDTVAHAETDALLFNTNGSLGTTDYLSGLTQTQQSQIVNFNVGNVAAAPTLSQWALIAMAGLLGLVGLSRIGFFGRRRQRSERA